MPRPSRLVALALPLALASAARAQPTVRDVRPRLWIVGDGRRGPSPDVIRDRCANGVSAWARACRAATPVPSTTTNNPVPGSEHTLLNLALRYVLYREPSVLSLVRSQLPTLTALSAGGDDNAQILSNAARARAAAVAYDWLYNDLQPSDRASFEEALRRYGDWYMEHAPADVFSAEAYVHAGVLGLVGLSLADPAADAGADAARYLAYADRRWKTELFPALAYTSSWWHEGPYAFTQHVARSALYLATAWTTATTEDLFAYARGHGDFFTAWPTYLSYVLRPDFRYAPFGDATESQLDSARTLRPVADMLAWGTGSTVAHALAEEATRRLPTGRDFNGPEAWQQVVFYSPERPARPSRVDLPTAAHLSPTAEDVVVMRSSWDDPDATWVSLSCGDWFSRRQHLEAGSVMIFRRAALAVHTGTLDGFESAHWLNWYAQRSAHANVVTVRRPGELFPNARMLPTVNDGGERSINYAGGGRRTLDEYRANLTMGAQYETASVTAFETSRYHDYAACDATRAYNSTAYATEGNVAKVSEVTRQVVFLRPELVVIFDRVEATDPSYETRFVMHALARPLLPSPDTFTVDRGMARLLGRTLLPATTTRGVIDGFALDGMDLSPNATGDEVRGSRVEVTDPARETRHYFLHLLDATTSSSARMPGATRVEQGDRVGLRVDDPSGDRSYTVLFSRTGAAAGSITVESARGDALYTGALGMGGTFYPPVTDAGAPPPPDAGGPEDAGAVDDLGLSPPPMEGGCACAAGGGSPAGGAWAMGVALVAMGVSRRRRRVSARR
ncbi:MAG: DUF4962 domain-containing protein [Polyangiales bacterium]